MAALAQLCHITFMEQPMSKLYFQRSSTPFGELFIYADMENLRAVLFAPWEHPEAELAIKESNSIIKETQHQLSQYFKSERAVFELPLNAKGTVFQQKVWKVLQSIPLGKTWSYGQLALAIGSKNFSRAVGAANGKNPISIIIPCHRVIGASGTLTGYAGGLDVKLWLLNHEGAL